MTFETRYYNHNPPQIMTDMQMLSGRAFPPTLDFYILGALYAISGTPEELWRDLLKRQWDNHLQYFELAASRIPRVWNPENL